MIEDLFGSAQAPLKKSDGYFMMSGTGPANETCRTCKHYTLISGHAKDYRKCGRMERRWTNGPGTDILARAPTTLTRGNRCASVEMRPMDENHTCTACGMSVKPRAYHPYAACLMFRACQNGTIVDANLQAVVEYGRLKERLATGKVKKNAHSAPVQQSGESK